jgi:uncharacterized protein (DUF885 family)
VNHAILRRTLANRVESERFAQRAQLFSNRGGWHLSTAQMHERVPLFTKADYESYLARLEAYPRYNQAAIETTREAIRTGAVHPCEPMVSFDASILNYAQGDPEKSSFFERSAPVRPSISEADWGDAARPRPHADRGAVAARVPPLPPVLHHRVRAEVPGPGGRLRHARRARVVRPSRQADDHHRHDA